MSFVHPVDLLNRRRTMTASSAPAQPLGATAIIQPLEHRLLLAADFTLSQNGLQLVDNSSFTLPAAQVGQTAQTTVFDMQNTSNNTISATAVEQVPAGQQPLLTISPNTAQQLFTGSGTQITVGINTSQMIQTTRIIRFTSTDASNNTKTINLRVGIDVQTPGGTPQLRVQFNGVTITDGDTTPSATDGTDFGQVPVNGQPVQRIFTINNPTNAQITLSGLSVSNGFSITSGALPTVLGPNQTVSFTVQMATDTQGNKTGTISFNSSVPALNPYTFSIKGVVGTPATGPDIGVAFGQTPVNNGDTTPSTADGTDFGSVQLASIPPTHRFVLTNTGSTVMNITSITGGPGFTVTPVGTVPTVVQPGATVSFDVALQTGTVGTKTTTISIGNDVTGKNPYTFTVTGTITSQATQADVAVRYQNIDIVDGDTTPSTTDGTDFGAATQGGTSIIRTFTIVNTGVTVLNLGTVSVTGGFAVSTQPGLTTLQPGQSTTFQIELLTTTQSDSVAGTVRFTTGVTGKTPYNFDVAGQVLQPLTPPGIGVKFGSVPIENGSTSTSPLNGTRFPTSYLGSTGTTRRFTISNTGGGTLSLSNIVVTGDFTLVDVPSVIQAGKSATLSVQINTTSVGKKSGSISFTTNVPGQSRYKFSLSGEVVASQAPAAVVVSYNGVSVADNAVTPSIANGTDFGTVVIGQPAPIHHFTITNNGAGSLILSGFTLPAGYELTNAFPTSIESGDSFIVGVRQVTTTPGVFTGQISFTTNVVGTTVYNFTITGKVAGVCRTPTGGQLGGVADFDNNGTPDLVWRDFTTGGNEIWLMNGTTRQQIVTLPSVDDNNWTIQAAGDISGDGKPDIIFFNVQTGSVVTWVMNGTQVADMKLTAKVTNTSWQMETIGDINKDGHNDLIWRNYSDGRNSVWYMTGVQTVLAQKALPSAIDTNWQLAGTGDYDGDGNTDLFWRNVEDGRDIVWKMNAKALVSTAQLDDPINTNWRIGAIADANGDQHPDVYWYNVNSGQTLIWYLDALTVTHSLPLNTFVSTGPV